MRFSQLRPGMVVDFTIRDGWSETVDRATFVGFTGVEEQYSETPRFDSLEEAKQHYGAKNQSELENVGGRNGYHYGHAVYAVFRESDGSTFAAYLFNGKWCIGSSAHPMQIRKVEQSESEKLLSALNLMRNMMHVMDSDLGCLSEQEIADSFQVHEELVIAAQNFLANEGWQVTKRKAASR